MRRGVRRLVDRHEDPMIPGQLGECLELGWMGHGVDHEQVVHAGRGQDSRLPHCGHGQAARARLELAAGEVRALVGLVVRADRCPAQLLELARHVVDVALRRVDVEHEGGSDQLLPSLSDRASVLVPDLFVGLSQDRRRIRHRAPPGRYLAWPSGGPGGWLPWAGTATLGPRQRMTRTGSGPAWTRNGRLDGNASVWPRRMGLRPKLPSMKPAPETTIAIEKRPSLTSISSATSSAVASKNCSTSSWNRRTSREPWLVRSTRGSWRARAKVAAASAPE